MKNQYLGLKEKFNFYPSINSNCTTGVVELDDPCRTIPGAQHQIFLANSQLHDSYNYLLREISSRTPSSIGNYMIIKAIGEGSFGKVYLAVHKITRTKVVLKSALKTQPHLVREIHHHRQFRHPHIARLYEIITTESLVWLVLEYCPGDELYNLLLKNGRIQDEEVKTMFAQLCGAVAYTHKNNCAHRDLKLENILLDKNNNVKLCDFGFTREYQPMSLLETICGTTCYMAPELILRKKYNGQPIDVWSLGVILYTLLYGEMPFEEDNEVDTKRKIIEDEPKYSSGQVSDEAISLLKKLLSKDPRMRPTVQDILAHPYLYEHSQTQIDILETPVPRVFSTKPEKRLLRHLRACHIDLDLLTKSVVAQSCDAPAGLWELTLEKEIKLEKRRKTNRGSLTLGKYSFSRHDGDGRRSRSTSKTRGSSATRTSSAIRHVSRDSGHSRKSPRSPLSKISHSLGRSTSDKRESRGRSAEKPDGLAINLGVLSLSEVVAGSSPVTPTFENKIPTKEGQLAVINEPGHSSAPVLQVNNQPAESISEENMHSSGLKAKSSTIPSSIKEQELTAANPAVRPPSPNLSSAPSITSTAISQSSPNKTPKSTFRRVLKRLILSTKTSRQRMDLLDISTDANQSENGLLSAPAINNSIASSRDSATLQASPILTVIDTPNDAINDKQERTQSLSPDLEVHPVRRPNSNVLSSQQRPVSQMSQFSAFSQISQYSIGSQISSANSQQSHDTDDVHMKNSRGTSSFKLRRLGHGRTSTSSSFSSLASLQHRHYSKASSISSASATSSPGRQNSRDDSIGDLDDSLDSLSTPRSGSSRFHHASSFSRRRNDRVSRASPIPSSRRYNEAAVFSAGSQIRPRRRSALAEAFSSLNPSKRSTRDKQSRGPTHETEKVADIPESVEEDLTDERETL